VHRATRFVLVACFILSAQGQKRPVTIDAINAEHKVTGFEPVEWAPGGKRFAWLEEKDLWMYDVASGQRKLLLDLGALESKAVKPAPDGAFDWKNRRVTEQRFSWSASGKEMLITTGGDLFLLHIESRKWDQLTARPRANRTPSYRPTGAWYLFAAATICIRSKSRPQS